MTRTPYCGFRFPKPIIEHAVWLYARFTLSLRDVEDLLGRLGAYPAAARELGLSSRHVRGKRKNNRAESSHVPIRRREGKMQGFPSAGSAQRSSLSTLPSPTPSPPAVTWSQLRLIGHYGVKRRRMAAGRDADRLKAFASQR